MESIDKRQYLIHLHTDDKERNPIISGINFGEIAVRHNHENPEILFKVWSGETSGNQYYVHIKDADWVTTQISGAQADIEDELGVLRSNLNTLSSSTISFSGATVQEFKAVSGYFLNHIEAVSGALYNRIEEVSGYIKNTIDAEHNTLTGFSAEIISNVNSLSADAHTDILAKLQDAKDYTNTASADIETTINALDTKVDAISGYVKQTYATSADTHNAIEAVKTDLGKVYKYKGSVQTFPELSGVTGAKDGDVYNVVEPYGTPGTPGYVAAGTNFAYVATEISGHTSGYTGHWDQLGGTIDLSTYATTAYVGTVSGNIKSTIDTLSGNVHTTIGTVSGNIKNTIETVSGYIKNTIETVSGNIKNTIDANHKEFTDFSGFVVTTYATSADVNSISGWIATHVQKNETDITNLSAGVKSVSGYILNYVDNTVSANIATTIANLSGSAINIESNLGELSGATIDIQKNYVKNIVFANSAAAQSNVVAQRSDASEDGITYTFDFSKLHIDCGSF